MKPRLFLIDPYLTSRLGHTADLARLYLDLAKADGYEPVVILPAGSQMDEAFSDYQIEYLPSDGPRVTSLMSNQTVRGHIHLLPPFLRSWVQGLSAYLFGERAHEAFLVQQSANLNEKVLRWLANVDFCSGDRLFFPTLSWAEAARVAMACEGCFSQFPESDVHCSVMLRFDPPHHRAGRSFISGKVPSDPRIQFVSDTRQLAEAYGAILGVQVQQILIPVEPRLSTEEGIQRKANPSRIVFLGESRAEKRFDMLPEIIEAFRRLKPSRPVQFYVQYAPVASQDQAKLDHAANRLRAMQGEDLVFVEGAHATDEFTDLLRSASIVLAPYKIANYRMRSSGLVIGALAAGAVIVAEGGRSWLSGSMNYEERTKRLSFFYGGSAHRIARALMKALDLNEEIHTGYLFPPQPKPWMAPLGLKPQKPKL